MAFVLTLGDSKTEHRRPSARTALSLVKPLCKYPDELSMDIVDVCATAYRYNGHWWAPLDSFVSQFHGACSDRPPGVQLCIMETRYINVYCPSKTIHKDSKGTRACSTREV